MKGVIVNLGENPSMAVVADSALSDHRRPVFVPDFVPSWSAELYVAARIGRLGKSIERKFVRRYIDGWTVALRLRPKGQMCDIAPVYDYCLTTGTWKSPDDCKHTLNGVGFKDFDFELDNEDLADAIEYVTRFATVKTGDIIIPRRLKLGALDVEVGDTVRVAEGDDELLSVRLK